VFSGKVPKAEWNNHWWNLREKYQKLRAPVERDELDFDPGAKYHIPGDSQYMNYFVAYMLQFQMHKALCLAAGEYVPGDPSKPLYQCDIDGNLEAGAALRRGLEPGLSQHWSESLKAMTGETKLSASAILEYFEPLREFLRVENKKLAEENMELTLSSYSEQSNKVFNELVVAAWDVQTNVGDREKQEIYANVTLESARFTRENFDEYFKDVEVEDFESEDIKRQLKFLTKMGLDILDDADLLELTEAKTRMEEVYSAAKICPFNKQNCNLATEGIPLDPDVTEIMMTSSNYDELKYVWTAWHDKFGDNVRSDYKRYVELSNKAAQANGFADYGDMWRSSYDDENFVKNTDDLWSKVEPLYTELLTFITRKLRGVYGDKFRQDELNGEFPAHVFGNMWAQSWGGLFDRTKPFKAATIDVTGAMRAQNYTPRRMFEMSDKFFMDLGLESNAMSYGSNAIIEKPTDRQIVCHASAWDFYDGEDFRIKMCTVVDNSDFVTVHHEMGHIQYFILYKDQPNIYRTGANPGFHEAVGDTIALSVDTPNHMKKIGLLPGYIENYEADINALYKMALDKVSFLPFGYVIDKWRWDVFSGTIAENEWTKKWWEYRAKYQKIKPPTARNEATFDPAAKYHIPADSQYIAYFVAHILQFQLHKALCIEAGQYDPVSRNPPLHKCDIDGSKAAGAKLRAGLQLGLSKHWSEALFEMTGERELTADALLEYFEPLYEYLKQANNQKDDETTSQLVPIIVGSVIGGVLAVGLVAYFVIRMRNRNTSNTHTSFP